MVNWNGQRFLDGFFGSLERQGYRDFRVHVVDNGSTDGSLAVVERYRKALDLDLLCLERNTGFAHANNLGIARAMDDDSGCVVTLNNDLELDADCLKNLARAIDGNPAQGCFQLLMVNFHDRTVIDAAGIAFSAQWEARQIGYKLPLARLDELATSVQAVCAGAAAYRKEALAAVRQATGYFDERFFAYSEDVDLGLRLMAHGITGLLVKDAVVYHVHSGTGGQDTPFKLYHLVRNRYLYLLKNLERKEFQRVRAFFMRQDCLYALKLLARGRVALTLSIARGYRAFHKLSTAFDADSTSKAGD